MRNIRQTIAKLLVVARRGGTPEERAAAAARAAHLRQQHHLTAADVAPSPPVSESQLTVPGPAAWWEELLAVTLTEHTTVRAQIMPGSDSLIFRGPEADAHAVRLAYTQLHRIIGEQRRGVRCRELDGEAFALGMVFRFRSRLQLKRGGDAHRSQDLIRIWDRPARSQTFSTETADPADRFRQENALLEMTTRSAYRDGWNQGRMLPLAGLRLPISAKTTDLR